MNLKVDLSILQLDQIIYDLAVKAVNSKGSSGYSNIEQFDNRARLATPTNVGISAGILNFDGVEDAAGYQIISDIGESSEIILGTV